MWRGAFREVKKFGLIALVAGGLAACSSPGIERFEGSEPALVMEEFFEGRSVAYGIFEGRDGQLSREFTVDILGEWDGEVLTLTEDFVYKDGEISQRIWKLRKVGEGQYIGTAADVIGEAEISVVGNAANFGYLLDFQRSGGGSVSLRFNDWMYLQDDKVLFNRARVSKFGFNLGEVTLVFIRGGSTF